MSFDIICFKNKKFWNRLLTVASAFGFVVAVMAFVFPI